MQEGFNLSLNIWKWGRQGGSKGGRSEESDEGRSKGEKEGGAREGGRFIFQIIDNKQIIEHNTFKI